MLQQGVSYSLARARVGPIRPRRANLLIFSQRRCLTAGSRSRQGSAKGQSQASPGRFLPVGCRGLRSVESPNPGSADMANQEYPSIALSRQQGATLPPLAAICFSSVLPRRLNEFDRLFTHSPAGPLERQGSAAGSFYQHPRPVARPGVLLPLVSSFSSDATGTPTLLPPAARKRIHPSAWSPRGTPAPLRAETGGPSAVARAA